MSAPVHASVNSGEDEDEDEAGGGRKRELDHLVPKASNKWMIDSGHSKLTV